MPRAGQWAIGGGVLVLVLLFYADYIMLWAGEWNEQADHLLVDAREAAGGDRRDTQVRNLRNVIQGLGPVERPGDEEEAEVALNDVVNEVLARHTVSRDSFNYRGPTKLKRGTLGEILEPGEHVESISGNLRFDASPEDAIAIIAELESHPTIEAVSDVRIAKQSGPRKVTVDLTIESWIVAHERRSRRGSTS
jgi:hypothetical protein